MSPVLPPDTRREAAYHQCRSILMKMEKGQLNYIEGILFLIQMLYFAETLEIEVKPE